MKRLKQLSAAATVLALTLSVGLTATAAGTYKAEITGKDTPFENNQAQTTVSAVYLPNDNLSATVPLNVTFAFKSDGNFICPEEYAITNTGSDYIHVTDISVELLDSNYSLVNSETLDENQIHLTMTATNPTAQDIVTLVCASGTEKQTFGTSSPTAKYLWNIAQDDSLSFDFSGKINSSRTSTFSEPHALFKIIYTIAEGAV